MPGIFQEEVWETVVIREERAMLWTVCSKNSCMIQIHYSVRHDWRVGFRKRERRRQSLRESWQLFQSPGVGSETMTEMNPVPLRCRNSPPATESEHRHTWK